MDSRIPSGVARRVAALALATGLLAGCADGLAPDAERGRRADEQRDSVVRDLQATETWNLIHGTPESTPEPGE
jgi:hypothetical protein